jgi:hypothetical protein
MAKKKLEDHPIAAVFPLLPKEELKELAKDIDMNGLLNPILLYETKILDGRNRYRAILTIPKMAEDLDPEQNDKGYFNEYEGNDPVGHVISLNCHRRHLTEAQRSAIATELANRKAGDNQHTGPANLPDLSQAKAAKLLNVSERSVRTAKAIKEADPELHAKVKSGEVSLNAAYKQIRPEPKAKPEPKSEPELQSGSPTPAEGISEGISDEPIEADLYNPDYSDLKSWDAKHRVLINRYLDEVIHKFEPEGLKELVRVFYFCMEKTVEHLKEKFGITFGEETDNS